MKITPEIIVKASYSSLKEELGKWKKEKEDNIVYLVQESRGFIVVCPHANNDYGIEVSYGSMKKTLYSGEANWLIYLEMIRQCLKRTKKNVAKNAIVNITSYINAL